MKPFIDLIKLTDGLIFITAVQAPISTDEDDCRDARIGSKSCICAMERGSFFSFFFLFSFYALRIAIFELRIAAIC